MAKNERVHQAVQSAVDRVDEFISGATLSLPDSKYRRASKVFLESKSASARTAGLFLTFYWLQDGGWDLDSVPIGIRGQFGDKLLCEELTRRHVTLSKTKYMSSLSHAMAATSQVFRSRASDRRSISLSRRL